MDIESRLSISFYKTVATINDAHKIYIVQNINTHQIYVKKILDVYNKTIYEYLKSNPIAHTPKIYELYEEDKQLTVIEEYISGDTIEQLLNNGYYFNNDTIRSIIVQLCKIISDFHKCKPSIIHRDIKPSNIIISPSNELYLLDFNAAKYQSEDKYEDTTLLGTRGYAAPEQYGFGSSTKQTDIYAIGMLLNTLVNGSFSQEAVLKSDFTDIIQKCIKLNASERYDNVESIIKIIKQANNLSAKTSYSSWKQYLPPGYRSLSPLNILLATVGYPFILWMSLSLEVKNTTTISLYIERFFFLIIFLSTVFFSSNYLDIQNYFPFCKSKNKLIRFTAIAFIDFIIIVSLLILMIIIISLIT